MLFRSYGNESRTQTLTSLGSTFKKITTMDTGAGDLNCTNDTANSKLTITSDGRWLITYSIAVTATTGDYAFAIKQGPTIQNASCVDCGVVNYITRSVQLTISGPTDIELYAAAPGVVIDLSVKGGYLSATKIGS